MSTATETSVDQATINAGLVFEETSRHLANIRTGYEKFFSVADLSEHTRRRWVQLRDVVAAGLVAKMYREYLEESGDENFAVYQAANAFVHSVVGRPLAGLVTLGRVWDCGPENLAVRTDIDGGLDWTGVNEVGVRVLPDDGAAGTEGVEVMPCERSMAYWLACRAKTSLDPIFDELSERSGSGTDKLWSIAGDSILTTAMVVPVFSGARKGAAHRRGQFVLDCLHESGCAVRTRSGLPRIPGSGPIRSHQSVA